MPKEIEKTLIEEARKAGAVEVRVVRGRNHPKLVGKIRGRAFTYAFPATPSDWRSSRNSLSDLRRVLGVKDGKGAAGKAAAAPRGGKQKKAPKTDRRVPETAEPIAALPEDRFHARLAELKQRLDREAASDRAEAGRLVRVRLRTPFLGVRERFVTIRN